MDEDEEIEGIFLGSLREREGEKGRKSDSLNKRSNFGEKNY
jgi:hypothetical protein